MSNALMSYAAEANLPDLKDTAALAAAMDEADDLHDGTGAGVYLKFNGKNGKWTMGQENKPCEGMFVFLPNLYGRGWTYWHNSKKDGPVRSILWSALDKSAKVAYADLEDLSDEYPEEEGSDGWKETRSMAFTTLEETPLSCQFKNNSSSGVRAMDAMFLECRTRIKKGEPFIPVVELMSEEFESNGYTNEKPVFAVDAWVTPEAIEAFYAGDLSEADLLAGKQPKKSRKK